MFSRLARPLRSVPFRRFQSTKSEPFNNKYKFNLSPPPIHEYWGFHNALVLIALLPVMYAIMPLFEYLNDGIPSFPALLEFANSEDSPMKSVAFGEPQIVERNQN